MHFNDLSQFNLGFLLFQPKASKPIMCVSLSTPEHPEGVQYILVGEERYKKRKLVTEEGKKWEGECQQIYKWTKNKNYRKIKAYLLNNRC